MFKLYKENIDTASAVTKISNILYNEGPEANKGKGKKGKDGKGKDGKGKGKKGEDAALKASKIVRFSYAGIKDKRGCTTQLCTVYRVHEDDLLRACKLLTSRDGILVEPVTHVSEPLQLGDLTGNRFDVLLRDVKELASVSGSDLVREHD